MRRIVITGLGVVSPLGLNSLSFWDALQNGKCAISHYEPDPLFDHLRVKIGARLNNFNPDVYFSASELALLDPYSQYAVVAAREAVADAGLDADDLWRSAAIVGTGCGGKQTDEETYQQLYKAGKRRAHPLTIPKGMPSAAASQVSMRLGIAGPVFSVSSACSSSNHAIAQGLAMIRSGLVEHAVVGGTDAPFTFGLMKAWEAMRVLSPNGCYPFSAERDGLVLGEGAGMLVLESLESARRRNALIYAELAGVGMSADAGHITDPSPEGAARAISASLTDSGIAPAEVDYINAHGTGTLANDISETRALHQVFGQEAKHLQISSTKSMHGHALGAAGALELVACAKAIQEGVIPPTLGLQQPGEGCDLDYVPNQARQVAIKTALSNSFAFGGLNSVVALRRI